MADKKKLNPRQQMFADLYCSGMSAKDAYIKAGFKTKYPEQHGYHLLQNAIIRELIEQKKAENSQKVDDKLAFNEDKALDRLVEIMDMVLTKDTIFAVIKACQDILDRRRGKPSQNVNVGGQEGNPIEHKLTLINASEFINNKPKNVDEDD